MTTTVYRDAAYSAETQERLRELLGRLTSVDGWNADPCVHALADVVERWDHNDATQLIVDDPEPEDVARPHVTGDPKCADRTIIVYQVPCPECGHDLEWAIRTPPIPLTLYEWLDPNGEGATILFCPSCDAELPQGDLTTKEEAR